MRKNQVMMDHGYGMFFAVIVVAIFSGGSAP